MSQEAPTPSPDPAVPTESGDRWALTLGGCRMEVDPGCGARICSFSLDGLDVLTGSDVDPDNYGSTFWTSPQADWGWPPVEEIDANPYAVVESDEGLVCASSFSSRIGAIVTKRFSTVPALGCFRVEYEISNQSSEILKVAPWEVSRVRGGVSLFAVGEPMPQPGSHEVLRVESHDGVCWFGYDRERVRCDQKYFAHSEEGWLAHVSESLLLLKTFDRVAADKQAPGEAMIELFASGSKDYVELEQQGSYNKIGPWKSLIWRVHWRLVKVPDGISKRVGSKELVDFVRAHLR